MSHRGNPTLGCKLLPRGENPCSAIWPARLAQERAYRLTNGIETNTKLDGYSDMDTMSAPWKL